MQDSPLDHTVPYPASGSYPYLNRENKIHVISSDANDRYHQHWQNQPGCWFCNSSGFWLTRRFNKHAVTILTQDAAGAAVLKAGACETCATAAVGNATCQLPERHFRDALPECGTEATAGRDPSQHEASTGPCSACSALAYITRGVNWYSTCRGSLTPPQKGLCIHHLCAGRTEGSGREWVEVLSPLSSPSRYYLHIPTVQAGTKEDCQKGSLKD